ncbi:MAG: hypothetical protein JNL73_08980 [Anaerolineales bacterium]|nr:hypothetical protein [Anaerolineales bacterium]
MFRTADALPGIVLLVALVGSCTRAVQLTSPPPPSHATLNILSAAPPVVASPAPATEAADHPTRPSVAAQTTPAPVAPTATTRPSTLAAATVPARPRVLLFEVEPAPLERGGLATIRWSVTDATEVRIWTQTYDPKTGRWHRLSSGQTIDGWASTVVVGSAQGQHVVDIPLDSRTQVRLELDAVLADGQRVAALTEVLGFRCYPSLLGDPTRCPLAALSVPASYQRFEHGHLIWRGDTDDVFMLSEHASIYVPWLRLAGVGAGAPFGNPPTGLHAPGAPFSGLWIDRRVNAGTSEGGTPVVREMLVGEILGWAIAPEQPYVLDLQFDTDLVPDGLTQDQLLLTLPDGRLARLLLSDGLIATTGPSWGLTSP